VTNVKVGTDPRRQLESLIDPRSCLGGGRHDEIYPAEKNNNVERGRVAEVVTVAASARLSQQHQQQRQDSLPGSAGPGGGLAS
jgi:hypothetical protein